jgi:hypothetical protein
VMVGGKNDLLDVADNKKSASDAFNESDDGRVSTTGYKSIFGEKAKEPFSRSRRGPNAYGYYQNITLIPQAFAYSYDTRLDDLTEYVPGLFGDPLDLEQADLIVGAAGQKGSISPEAKVLLDTARAAQRAARYQTKDGDTLEVTAEGSFLWERHFDTGLREEMSYDGINLVHKYIELSLVTRRESSPIEALLYARWAPFLTVRPEALSLYNVTAKGNELVLAPLQLDASSMSITFGANGRPSTVRIGKDVEITLQYKGDSIELTSGKETTLLTTTPTKGFDTKLPADFVVVTMPLVEPTALVTTAVVGSEEWRAVQVQKLASYSALSNLPERMNVLRSIVKETKTLRRGELALASGGIQQIIDKKELKQLTSLLSKEDALGQYATAIWRINYSSRGVANTLNALAAKNKGSLLGMISSYRAILSTTQGYYNAPASSSIEGFLNEYPFAPFCYILVYQYSSYYSWQNVKATISLWNKLADTIEPLRYFARYEAARSVYNNDYQNRETAADLFEELMDEELSKGNEPLIDYTLFYALSYTAEGQTRWQRFFNKWRGAALQSGSAESLSNWLGALTFTGRQENEVNRVVPALRQLKFKSAEEVMPLIEVFSSYGRYDVAQDLLAPWLTQKDTPAGLFDVAAQLAQSNGDNVLAADYLSRSLELLRDQPLPLVTVREKYQRLFTLYSREAQSLQFSAGAVEKALSLAAEWRSFDPDFPERELMCASLLYSTDQPEEAWRYVSTIIELHPGEGASFETVATYLEGESQWESALSFWERAFVKEPTNPTWLHRQALLALTMGNKEEAKSLLSQIEQGKWQDRFVWVTYQAKNLQKQLKK